MEQVIKVLKVTLLFFFLFSLDLAFSFSRTVTRLQDIGLVNKISHLLKERFLFFLSRKVLLMVK